MPTPHDLELALQLTRDRSSFLKNLLIDALAWPIPNDVESPEDIAYTWSAADLRAQGLDKPLVAGQVWQIQSLQANQPWGIFLLEFKNSDAFTSGRGLTGPLRKVLRGLVPSRRQHSQLATWKRENLLFICTHQYEHFRFAYFKAPPDNTRAAPLAAFGWGPDMPARTACEFNLPALIWPDTGTNYDDWVNRWASAFDVEKVTKKFYEEYKTLFEAIEKAIAAENGLKNGEDLRMFTQSLVNRLMFLRFLERKGWLKFNGNENYLRALYDAGPLGKKSFYRGRLMPLFFEGLAIEKHGSSDAFGKVPFLNGGLFEANELDKRIKEVPYAALGGLIGEQGLFYRYNFTVEESTPLDIEVAVDPEMLGKVFEELVTGRHESGSYYTPRPIVSFMCRETLKSYLTNRTKASADAIAALVDQATVAGLTEANGRQILEALDSLKAVDPACGSGAYLLGLLHELVAIYRLLISEKLVKDRRSLYDLKLRIISHNLYGVDIDPFATNIAMLRLWLSLEVEADEPLPLPNLDFKIETGDSLLGPDPTIAADLYSFSHQLRVHADALIGFKEKYLTAHGEARNQYRTAIARLEKDVEAELKTLHGEGIIDWRIQFAEVFVRNQGFDLVIGNPPYVRQEQIKHLKPALKELYECYTGVADLFVYFYERGIKLLRPGGQFAFITSNKWYRAGYGEKLRSWLAANTRLHHVIDFGDAPVFEAIAYPTIVLLERAAPDEAASFRALNWQPGQPIDQFAAIVRAQSFEIPQKSLDTSGWRLEGEVKRKLLEKLRAAGTPLGEYCNGRLYYGIQTGLNDAFVINRETRDSLIAEHPSSEVMLKPFLRGRDVKRWRVEPQDQWLVYVPWHFPLHLDSSVVGASKEAEKRFRNEYPAIYKYLHGLRPQLMSRNKTELGVRYEWYAMQRWGSEYWREFAESKIVVPTITDDVNYAPDDSQFFTNDKTSILIPPSVPYALGVLNSSASAWFTRSVFASKQGRFFECKPMYLRQVPIPAATPQQQTALEELVRRILAWYNAAESKNARDALMLSYFEQVLNGLVYELYFPDELHTHNLRLFDIVAKAHRPPVDSFSKSMRLAHLRDTFEAIYDANHPLRGALHTLRSLEIVRIIEEEL